MKNISLRNYKKILKIAFVGAIFGLVLFLFIDSISEISNQYKRFSMPNGKDILLNYDGNLNSKLDNIGIEIEVDFVDPDMVGKGIWNQLVESIRMTTNAFATIFLDTLQNLIFILFDGSIVYDTLNITYETYLTYILIIFFIALILFVGTRLLTRNGGKRTKNLSMNIFGSLMLIIMFPLFFQISFLITRYLLEHVFNLDWNSLNIHNMIDNASNGALSDKLKPFNIIVPIEFEFFTPVPTHVVLNLRIYGSLFNDNDLNMVILFTTIFITWFIIYLFVKFVFRLMLRIVDVIIYGFIAYPIVIASSVEDDGMRMRVWMSNLIKKIFMPFLMIVMYIIMIISTNEIIDVIDFGGIDLPYDKNNAFESIFKLFLIIFPFIVLEIFSKRWVYQITRAEKQNINVELSEIIGNNSKSIKSFDSQPLVNNKVVNNDNNQNTNNNRVNVGVNITNNNSNMQNNNKNNLNSTIKKVKERQE